MPADYNSTARALALPISPEDSPSPTFEAIQPPWSRSRANSAHHRRSSSLYSLQTPGVRDRTMAKLGRAYRRATRRFLEMTPWQRVGAVCAAIASMVFGLGFMMLTGQVFVWLKPVADEWENSKLAYFILWISVVIVSFPPLIGWSTMGTISGYLFGVWKGWAIFASASVVGSFCSFILSRTVLRSFVQRLMEKDTRFAALSLTLKHDGLKLLCMIRLCPLPYSLCNGAISTFPTVRPHTYALATAIITPKLLVATFIGNRLRVLNGDEMSAGAKAINLVSILVSITISIFTAWYIYRITLARAKELEEQEQRNQTLPVNLRHSRDNFSDDPSRRRDEEEGFATLYDDDPQDIDLGLQANEDEDHVALGNVVVGDDDDELRRGGKNGYKDEFTDNDSDVFEDGDGDDEVYGLHRHVSPK
ncbi:Tlg2-vesicle protein [Arachnomyces sp. PD_36]|nr:Tlg2-vesicle protein [Arachnomyces sp. PD_36]